MRHVKDMTRMPPRRPLPALFVAALILATVGFGGYLPQTPAAFDLDEASIDDLQQRMASGRDTARSLAEKYLARIEAIDRRGPTLRSVIETNPDALTIANDL